MQSVSACVSMRTLNKCTSCRRISILFNKEPRWANNFCLKALPDHSFMCHFPEFATFVGPHDNRIVGTKRKERDACQSGYIHAWPGGDGSEHDTSVTGHWETLFLLPLPPLMSHHRLMVVKLERACTLVSCTLVVMWNPIEVTHMQDGCSIDKARRKER